MATNADVVDADLANNRWNGNSPRQRLVQSWDIVVEHYYHWRYGPDYRKVVELVEHGVVVLDTDTVGEHVLGFGGNESTREQDDGARGGCHEEEDRGMKDNDIANTADPGYSHEYDIVVVVVEADENDIGRKEEGEIVTKISETVVHRGTRYGSLQNHPPLVVTLYSQGRGRRVRLLLVLPQ